MKEKQKRNVIRLSRVFFSLLLRSSFVEGPRQRGKVIEDFSERRYSEKNKTKPNNSNEDCAVLRSKNTIKTDDTHIGRIQRKGPFEGQIESMSDVNLQSVRGLTAKRFSENRS